MMKNIKLLLFLTVVISFVTKISGLLREVITGYYFGASLELDTFYYIYSIPELIMSGLTAAIAIAIIPTITKKADFDQNDHLFVDRIISIGSLIFIILILVALLFTAPILSLVSPNNEITFDYLSIWVLSLIQIVPTYILSIYMGLATRFEKYKKVTILSLPFNFLIIVFIYFFSEKIGIISIALGMITGIFAQVLYLSWDLRKNNYLYKPTFNLNDKSTLKEFMLILLPVYFGTVIQRISIFVDRSLANNLETGSISALSYADRIIQMVVSIVISTVGMIMFSKISITKDIKETQKIINSSLIFSIFCLMPITVYMIIYGEDIVNILFNRGQFDEKALHLTTISLVGYSIGLIGICVRYLLNRVFFANNDVRTPTINTLVYSSLNLILSVILCKFYGLLGIVLSSSIIMTLSCIPLSIKLHKKYKIFESLNWMDLIKILLSSVGMALSLYFIALFTEPFSSIYRLLISLVSGSLLYLTFIILLKIEEMDLGSILIVILRKLKIIKKNVEVQKGI